MLFFVLKLWLSSGLSNVGILVFVVVMMVIVRMFVIIIYRSGFRYG